MKLKHKRIAPLLVIFVLATVVFTVLLVTQANRLRQQLDPFESTAVITFDPEALTLVWSEGNVQYRVDFRAGVMTDGVTSLPLTFHDWTVALPILSGIPEYCRISVEWFKQGGRPQRAFPPSPAAGARPRDDPPG